MTRISGRVFALRLVGLACLALPLVATAQTYTVDVQSTLNDLPIKVESVPFDGRLVMKFTNTGTVKARCELRYDASPQPIRRTHVYVKPGKSAESSFQAKRKWFKVNVEVTCTPSDK